ADKAIEVLAAEQAAQLERQKLEATRLQEAKTRYDRLSAQLTQALNDRKALGTFDYDQLEKLKADAADAATQLDAARKEAEALEGSRVALVNAEAQARKAMREYEDQLGRLSSEARGLSQILSGSGKQTAGGPPVLDAVRPDKGYELALAAALGDDLNLSLTRDAQALAFWSEGFENRAAKMDLSALGVEPLSAHVRAPDALSLRLSTIGVVAQGDGDRLQSQLPIGARLVSKEGDLWRWDGMVVRAKAPKPAAVRLAQRNRLEELEAEIASLRPKFAEAQTAEKTAAEAPAGHENTLRQARQKVPDLERNARARQQAFDDRVRAQTQYEAKREHLEDSLKRLEGDHKEIEHLYKAAVASQSQANPAENMGDMLAQARKVAETHRQAVMHARAALDQDVRDRQARENRERTLSRELSEWTRRTGDSSARIT
ncbi:MAG: chromosome segregation protein SMC, partial [Asticcacaulis sp.]|nr:chromosome segregation protein SMC [Asticcacaulis sp.]